MFELFSRKFFSLLLSITLLLSFSSDIFAQMTASSSTAFSLGQTAGTRHIQSAGGVETCIKGYVRSANYDKNHRKIPNSKYIIDIQVDLLDATGMSIIQTSTDEQGFFSFRCPRLGSYYLNLPDYWSLGRDMSDPSTAWHAVESSDCHDTVDIEIALPPQSSGSDSCRSSYQYNLYQNNIQTAQCIQHMLFLPVVIR